ncbi:MAG: aconitate hydratase [Desulfohalobiaceae bacterium]|nr:aconitate hydratase [Desulfohalobiaceae bacterium]
MGDNLTRKIIAEHLLQGNMEPGEQIGLRVDQTLTQDATGTMAYLQFEAMDRDKVATDLSVSYVDHNTLQMGFRNSDDHRYLQSVAARYGLVFSPPGNGISHQLHLENFAKPGITLLGSDSHTPTGGGVGALAMGAGGLAVALALAGEAYTLPMPRVVRVYLTGQLRGWASAKDVILTLLARLTIKGGVGAVMEYTGPGVETLSVPERATITNMGAELGATTSIFPGDEQTRRFLGAVGREEDFTPLGPDPDARYDHELRLDLDTVEPMAAAPHMPDRGVPVRELDGLEVDQVILGSCTNSSYADLARAAGVLRGGRVHPGMDALLSPGSRQVLRLLEEDGMLGDFLDSGVRLLECVCGPCLGMGGSPVSGGVSLRTFNRNFQGRSGTADARVYLASSETAAQAALAGCFTDPSRWGEAPEKPRLPDYSRAGPSHFQYPPRDGSQVEVRRGPNIEPLPHFEPLPKRLALPVLLKTEDDITTDHILPGGPEVTALRSNVPAISEYVFQRVDPEFVARARNYGQGIIVGGENYGQGSSREHAALAPRYLGVRVVLAKSLARIHRANLINFGILPLIFQSKADYARLEQGENIGLASSDLVPGGAVELHLPDRGDRFQAVNDLSRQELDIVLAGGRLEYVRSKNA